MSATWQTGCKNATFSTLEIATKAYASNLLRLHVPGDEHKRVGGGEGKEAGKGKEAGQVRRAGCAGRSIVFVKE